MVHKLRDFGVKGLFGLFPGGWSCWGTSNDDIIWVCGCLFNGRGWPWSRNRTLAWSWRGSWGCLDHIYLRDWGMRCLRPGCASSVSGHLWRMNMLGMCWDASCRLHPSLTQSMFLEQWSINAASDNQQDHVTLSLEVFPIVFFFKFFFISLSFRLTSESVSSKSVSSGGGVASFCIFFWNGVM